MILYQGVLTFPRFDYKILLLKATNHIRRIHKTLNTFYST